MSRLNKYILATLAFAIAGGFASVSRATEATINNYGNTPIYVAIAYKFNYEGHIAKGWIKVDPRQTRTFTAPDDRKMALLVHRDGKPLSFPKHQEFLKWPTAVGQQFTVDRPTDDATVRFLHWGENLQNSSSVLKGHYPTGWALTEFFLVGDGKQKLEVKPTAETSLAASKLPSAAGKQTLAAKQLAAKTKKTSPVAPVRQQEQQETPPKDDGGLVIIDLPQ